MDDCPLPQTAARMPKLGLLLALFLALGLLFRVAHLDQKVFWVDEVSTVIRAAGYTKAEVTAQLIGPTHAPADLLAYQRLTPDRTLANTLHALSLSPEHTPLYFLLVRGWMQIFGSSVVAVRSFSVLCSVLVLPCAAWFCQQLFTTDALPSQRISPQRIGQVAMLVMAISPFFVAYAQEARPYSFWLLTLVLCSGALLRALRTNSRASWLYYTVTLILSSYTSLLSLLLALGQGIYVVTLAGWRSRITSRYFMALGCAGIAFLPWLWIIGQQQTALADNTTWMRTAIEPLSMVAIWLYSFAVLFFDVPVVASGWIAVVQAGLAAAVLTCIGLASWKLGQTDRRVWLLLVAMSLPVPLALILLDVIFHGQVSATPRYLIPSQFSALIAVSYYLVASPSQPKRQHQTGRTRTKPCPLIMASFLLSLSLISCLGNLNRSPDYQKDRNRHNPEVAAMLNQAGSPRLLAEPEQTLDLLSLSHHLHETVQIQILPAAQLIATLGCPSSFLLNPSDQLLATIRRTTTLNPEEIYQPPLLTPADLHLSLWIAEADTPATPCPPKVSPTASEDGVSPRTD